MLTASNDPQKLDEVKTKFSSEFDMKILGGPKEYLGISIKRDRKNQTIELSQEKYIEKMLAKFGFDEPHPQRSPMVTTQVSNRERKIREEELDEKLFDETRSPSKAPYREAVENLLYSAGATRPDIAYIVNVVSRHQINLTEAD